MSTRHFLLLAAVPLVLLGCASPVKPDGADAARSALITLKSDVKLAPQVQAALADAELSVQAAEVPTRDALAGRHAVHVAQRKIDIARFDAERKLSEAALRQLEQQRASILAESQAQELAIARAQSEAAAAAAIIARAQAEQARVLNANLRSELDAMPARITDRGPLLSLPDALFATGKAELLPGAMQRLDRLAAFMNRHADRSLLIESHADGLDGDEKSLLLAQRRAEAVKVYLIIQSVDAARLSLVSAGQSAPLADNLTAEGREQNRRVEIVISENSLR